MTRKTGAFSIGLVGMIYYALFVHILDKAGDLCSILHIKRIAAKTYETVLESG